MTGPGELIFIAIVISKAQNARTGIAARLKMMSRARFRIGMILRWLLSKGASEISRIKAGDVTR